MEFYNRQTLWNKVDEAEKRYNSRTAREITLALPEELSLDKHKEILRKYILENFIKLGMCADMVIHDKGDGNPHSHILLTDRPISKDGFTKSKNRDCNKKRNLYLWREKWANILNLVLERDGFDIKVSHECLKMQGIDREPTKHIGYKALQLEKKGISTEKVKEHKAILERNRQRELDMELNMEMDFEF